MNNKNILSLARVAYKHAKTKDFREQMQPLEVWMASVFINFYYLAVLAEREECAQVCDQQGKMIGSTGTTCAKSIRARAEP
jgi:hypothetical protein